MAQTLLRQFVVLFLLTNAIGLIVASTFLVEEVDVVVISPDKESVENTAGLFIYILVTTAILLLLIRFLPKKLYLLLKIFEGFALYYTATLVLWALLLFAGTDPLTIAIIPAQVALLLVILRGVLVENIWLRNLSTVILAAGIGALIGTGVGPLPIVLFLFLMAAYDYIAVFKTKHMVTLATAVTNKNLSFTFSMPTRDHTFELGTGDLVLPLAFAVSVLHQSAFRLAYPYYYLPSIAILAASLAGLLFTLHQSQQRVGKPLPALPIQAVLMILVYLVLETLL